MPLSKEELKAAMKESIHEWLDEKFASFGKWSMRALSAAVFAGLMYFLMWVNGYHK